MQAEGIRRGDRYDHLDARGRVVGGWTADGDAVVEGNTVYVPVRLHDGQDATKVYRKGEQVALTFGVGNVPAPEHYVLYHGIRYDVPEESGIEQLRIS